MWVVGIKRPYYPSVSFHDNFENAFEEYEKMLKEEPEEDGTYTSIIFLAEVNQSIQIKTNY